MRKFLRLVSDWSFIFFKIYLLVSLILISSHVHSQDTNHWGNQFGTRAALLGGAVLSDTLDNAGVFYNPANLAFLDTSSLSLNANFYGIENIRVENALGERADFRGFQFNTIPLLISGSINTKRGLKINYGLLTPLSFKFNGIARIDRTSNLVNDSESPGMEELLAESSINTRVQETSLTIGVSKKVGSNLGLGLSLINTLRSLDYSYQFSAKTLTNRTEPLLISRTQNEFVHYFTVRSALKAGINFQGGGYGLGLTITSPGLNIFGNGTVAEDLTLVNVLNESGDNRFSAYASDRQEKLKANYKSPLEIAIGGHKTLGKNTFHLNLTHYFGINTYRIIEVEPNVLIRPDLIQGITSSDFLNVETAMKSVTNVALGWEQNLKPTLSLMGSFRTDFSFYDSEPALGNQITTEFTQWDIYHFAFGGVKKNDNSSLTIGITSSFGKTDAYAQEVNYSESDPNPPLEGAFSITKAKYFKIGLLIGYSLYFKKLN